MAPISEGDSVLLPPDSILQSLRDRKCLIKLISARNLHHFLHCILRLIIRLCTSSNAVYGGTKVFQEILVDLKIPIILKGTKLYGNGKMREKRLILSLLVKKEREFCNMLN